MTSTRTDRRLALTIGAILSAFFVLGSAIQVASWTIGSVEKRQVVRLGAAEIPGPVDQVMIDARSADVTLVASQTGEVVIDSRASGTLHTPKLEVHPDGSRVEVNGGCPDVTFGHCSAEIVVHVPAKTAVSLTAGSGDIVADGLQGNVNLRTASGDVSATNLHSAVVALRSSSGDVAISQVESAHLSARSNSGDVTVELGNVPETVEARTNSGDVAIIVPPGDQPYRVDAETNSGDRNVGVSTSSTSNNVLSAHTHSGDVTIDYGP